MSIDMNVAEKKSWRVIRRLKASPSVQLLSLLIKHLKYVHTQIFFLLKFTLCLRGYVWFTAGMCGHHIFTLHRWKVRVQNWTVKRRAKTDNIFVSDASWFWLRASTGDGCPDMPDGMFSRSLFRIFICWRAHKKRFWKERAFKKN